MVAVDPTKNLEMLNLSAEKDEKKHQPGLTWKKSKNSERRFWFLQEVEKAEDALECITELSQEGEYQIALLTEISYHFQPVKGVLYCFGEKRYRQTDID